MQNEGMQFDRLSLEKGELQTYRGRLFLSYKHNKKQVVVFKGKKLEKSSAGCFGDIFSSKEITFKLKHLQKVVIGQISSNQVHLACIQYLKNQTISDYRWISLIGNQKQGDLLLYKQKESSTYQLLLFSCRVFCSLNHLLNVKAEESEVFPSKRTILYTNTSYLRHKMLTEKIEQMAVDMFNCSERKLMVVFLFYVAI